MRVCARVLGEVVEDSVLRFHQFVQDTVPITINQRNTGQLLPLFCQTLKHNKTMMNCLKIMEYLMMQCCVELDSTTERRNEVRN